MEHKKEELEEYGVVLDFLPTGRSFSTKSEPVSEVVGESKFTLLEVIPKPGAQMKIGERVYIGKGDRDKIALIKTRLNHDELTEVAKNELRNAVYDIIKRNEARFVELFNTLGPINIREHALELLPGVGKKNLKSILQAREEKKFENFADISTRIPQMQDPAKLLAERVIVELSGETRFYILTRPYPRKRM